MDSDGCEDHDDFATHAHAAEAHAAVTGHVESLAALLLRECAHAFSPTESNPTWDMDTCQEVARAAVYGVSAGDPRRMTHAPTPDMDPFVCLPDVFQQFTALRLQHTQHMRTCAHPRAGPSALRGPPAPATAPGVHGGAPIPLQRALAGVVGNMPPVAHDDTRQASATSSPSQDTPSTAGADLTFVTCALLAADAGLGVLPPALLQTRVREFVNRVGAEMQATPIAVAHAAQRFSTAPAAALNARSKQDARLECERAVRSTADALKAGVECLMDARLHDAAITHVALLLRRVLVVRRHGLGQACVCYGLPDGMAHRTARARGAAHAPTSGADQQPCALITWNAREPAGYALDSVGTFAQVRRQVVLDGLMARGLTPSALGDARASTLASDGSDCPPCAATAGLNALLLNPAPAPQSPSGPGHGRIDPEVQDVFQRIQGALNAADVRALFTDCGMDVGMPKRMTKERMAMLLARAACGRSVRASDVGL